MKRTTITIVMAMLAGCTLLGGCNQPDQEESKEQAYQRWYDTRAAVLVSLGNEQFSVGDMDAAYNSAKEALSLSPNMTSAILLMARVSIEKDRHKEAMTYLDAVAEMEPANPMAPYLMAVIHERRQRYDEALKLYEKARALDPANPAYVLASAETLVALGKPGEALELIESKLTSTDTTGDVYVAAGDVAMLAGEYERASDHYKQARFLSAEDLLVREKLARAGYFAGDHSTAVGILRRLATEADYADKVWVHQMLGDSYLALGQAREAKNCFTRVTELAPNDARNWSGLAKAALAAKDPARAVLSARRALEINPRSEEASLVLGCALLEQDEATAANAVLAEAVRMHPRNAMLRCLLGRSYEDMGDEALAMQCYQDTLRLEPGNEVAMHCLKNTGQ